MIVRPDLRFTWTMPLLGALAALFTCLPSMIYGNDFGAFLATLILVPSVAVIILIAAAVNLRRKALSAMAMVTVFCLVAFVSFRESYVVYTTARWLRHAERYKAEVLEQPTPADGQFKHILWDEWGWAGSGSTVAYLVFDPQDQLTRNNSGNAGHPPGLPCDVWRTHRLASHWYTVTFYSDTSWDDCR